MCDRGWVPWITISDLRLGKSRKALGHVLETSSQELVPFGAFEGRSWPVSLNGLWSFGGVERKILVFVSRLFLFFCPEIHGFECVSHFVSQLFVRL